MKSGLPKIALSLVLGILLLAIVPLGFFLKPTPNEVASNTLSIFEHDSCAPPCWFGLIPGESTKAEVELMYQNYRDLFLGFQYTDETEANSSDLATGHYDFYWSNYAGWEAQQSNSIINIDNNIISHIIVSPREVVSLGQLIDMLGLPDDIRYEEEEVLYLQLLYLDSLFGVVLRTSRGQPCSLHSIRDDFFVDTVDYRSYESAILPVESSDGTMQPQLIAYRGASLRQVPLDTWGVWLSGELSMTCREAGRLLTETVILPEFP